MLTRAEKIISYIDSLPFDVVRRAWVARARVESDRLEEIKQSLLDSGMEQVDCVGPVTPDGREIMRIRGLAYALRQDAHAERLAQRFETAKNHRAEPETKSVAGTEALSSMACPKCGDSLQHTAVCPKCAAGKLGYSHRYTCVCGGVDLISKEAL